MQGKLTGPRRLIYSMDPAIDRSDEEKADEALRHANEKGDTNGLPLKDGQLPVIWHLRSLSVDDYSQFVLSSAHQLQQAMANQRIRSAVLERTTFPEYLSAFALGLVKADGATDADGEPLRIEFDESGGRRKVSKATLDAIFQRYKAGLFVELGRQVIEACEVPPT